MAADSQHRVEVFEGTGQKGRAASSSGSDAAGDMSGAGLALLNGRAVLNGEMGAASSLSDDNPSRLSVFAGELCREGNSKTCRQENVFKHKTSEDFIPENLF